MTDIVRETLRRVMEKIANHYGMPDEVAALFCVVENEVKQEFGGERVSIHRPGVDKTLKIEAVRRDYINTDQPVEAIASKHGISRATLYNYLKHPSV